MGLGTALRLLYAPDREALVSDSSNPNPNHHSHPPPNTNQARTSPTQQLLTLVSTLHQHVNTNTNINTKVEGYGVPSELGVWCYHILCPHYRCHHIPRPRYRCHHIPRTLQMSSYSMHSPNLFPPPHRWQAYSVITSWLC